MHTNMHDWRPRSKQTGGVVGGGGGGKTKLIITGVGTEDMEGTQPTYGYGDTTHTGGSSADNNGKHYNAGVACMYRIV